MVVVVVAALLLDVGPRPGEPATACLKELQSRSPPSDKSLKNNACLLFFSCSSFWARDRLGKSVKKYCVFIAFQRRLLKTIVFYIDCEKSPDSVSDRVAGQAGQPWKIGVTARGQTTTNGDPPILQCMQNHCVLLCV